MNISAYVVPGITIDKINKKVMKKNRAMKYVEAGCEYFNLTPAQLFMKRRQRPLVYARQCIMFLMMENTQLSLKDVGLLFGQDHTTVIHARNTIKDRIYVKDGEVVEDVAAIDVIAKEKLKVA